MATEQELVQALRDAECAACGCAKSIAAWWNAYNEPPMNLTMIRLAELSAAEEKASQALSDFYAERSNHV